MERPGSNQALTFTSWVTLGKGLTGSQFPHLQGRENMTHPHFKRYKNNKRDNVCEMHGNTMQVFNE